MMRSLLILTLAWLVAAAASASQVIAPVHVVDMRSGEIAQDRAVVVAGNRIEAVVAAGEAPDTGATLINGGGGWLIPGLAEMHAHIPSHDAGEQRVRDVLALFLAHGVTTVRGMLGEPWHLELRGLLESGAWDGPRLITSGPSFNGNTVTSPEQAAERVREQAAAGYDFLKLHPGLQPEEFQALAAAARELDIPFAGHVSWEVGLDAALASGQATIDHLDGYAQELVPPDHELAATPPSWFGLNLAPAFDLSRVEPLARSTVAAGVWTVPTQSLFETTAGKASVDALLARPGMEYLSDDLRERWAGAVRELRSRSTATERERLLGARRALLRALAEAGPELLLLGSDAPQIMNVPGVSVHQEMLFLVAEAGLDPLVVLQSATVNVSRFLGDGDRRGIAPGMIADFVLLGADPTADIRATRSVRGVMRDGRWFGRDRLDAMLAAVRERGL